jgi:hypothetical protein
MLMLLLYSSSDQNFGEIMYLFVPGKLGFQKFNKQGTVGHIGGIVRAFLRESF